MPSVTQRGQRAVGSVRWAAYCTPPAARLFVLVFIASLVTPFNTSGYVNTQEAIDIGGIKQWITIKGTDENNPVLLYLHGGPGNSAMGYAEKVTKELQKYFVVVQWDQRESGKTAELNHTNVPLGVDLMESDGVEVINYLRYRFSKDKIYLVGHSWGGFLGLTIANHHPELLEAYFAVSPMIYQDESEKLALEWLKARAQKSKNAIEMKELQQIQVPFQSADDLYYHRKWLLKAMGTDFKAKEARLFVDNWAKTWLPLFQAASHVNFFEQAPEIRCPIYFMVGSKDRQTSFKLTEDYYKMLKAEKKELFWFTESAHNPNTSEPAKFQQIIISHRTIKK